MRAILTIGEEEILLSKEWKFVKAAIGLDSNMIHVLPFIYLVQNIETHFISLRTPTEEQEEYLQIMEAFESGIHEFNSETEMREFLDKYEELVGDGIGNQDVQELGGIGIKIEGDKYVLEYYFDGICPSEKISTVDGKVLSEISRSRIYISLLNGDTLCDFSIESINNPDLGISLDNGIEDFIKSSLNEESLPSVGVIMNEFPDNKRLERAFKRIYAPAYKEKNNALKDIIVAVDNGDGTLGFLTDLSDDVISKGIALYPNKQLIYTVEEGDKYAQ